MAAPVIAVERYRFEHGEGFTMPVVSLTDRRAAGNQSPCTLGLSAPSGDRAVWPLRGQLGSLARLTHSASRHLSM